MGRAPCAPEQLPAFGDTHLRSIPTLGLLAVATVVLAACAAGGGASTPAASTDPSTGASQGGTPATTEALSGRTFLSTGIEGAALADGSQVRLTFEATRIGGSAGCNQMSGEYEVVDGALKVGMLAMTEMACEEQLMAQDTWLSGFLDGATATLDDTTLTLAKDGTTLTLQDESIVNPDLPLEGTRWVVTSVIANDAVSSVPAGAEASLVFDASSVAVESGCNSGSGTYETQDDLITFGPIATTLKMCVDEGVGALEQAVLGVLQGEVESDIDGSTLTLTKDGTGLVLTAAG
jgi:heat shock protein HslJ